MNLFGDVEPALCAHNQQLGTYCSLCDYEATRATEEAIKQAEENASQEWATLAWQTLKLIAENRLEFTTDDLWAELERYPNITTHEPRAMGAIMRKAIKHKWIQPTGRYVKTKRPIAHQKPIAVWKSLAYRDPEQFRNWSV